MQPSIPGARPAATRDALPPPGSPRGARHASAARQPPALARPAQDDRDRGRSHYLLIL